MITVMATYLVLGADMKNAVGIDVEGDLDLRHASRRRRYADKLELAQTLVVGRHLTLALQNLDLDLHRERVSYGLDG